MRDFSVVVVQHEATPEHFYHEKLNAFADVRVFTSAVDALQHLDKNPATVLLAEYDMPELNGIDVADSVRDIDAERGHFTYVIVTSHEEGAGSPANVDEPMVDAFVNRDDGTMIHAFVAAGMRLASRINELISENRALQRRCDDLEKAQLVDPVTGLGNRRFAEQTLDKSIRQIESRGGAVCLLSIAVQNYAEVLQRYDERIASALMTGISDRILHLVRPLDVVTCFNPGEFALVLVQPTIEHCTAECYQRIFDGVRLKSYKTAAGFLDVRIAMSVCAASAETGAPDPDIMIRTAQGNLREASRQGKILVTHLTSGV